MSDTADDSGPIDATPRRRATDRDRGPVRLETATVGITIVAGAALGLGVYFYSALVTANRDVAVEVRATREALSAISTRVTVLESARQAERLEERVRDNDRRITTLEARSSAERSSNGNGGPR